MRGEKSVTQGGSVVSRVLCLCRSFCPRSRLCLFVTGPGVRRSGSVAQKPRTGRDEDGRMRHSRHTSPKSRTGPHAHGGRAPEALAIRQSEVKRPANQTLPRSPALSIPSTVDQMRRPGSGYEHQLAPGSARARHGNVVFGQVPNAFR